MNPNPHHVVLIEDSRADARLIQEMLAQAGEKRFHLEWVDRLSAGLERLAAGGVDLVLLDLSLPDSQGLETFTRVQSQTDQIPIVILSGLDDESLAVDAVCQGAQDYLLKGEVTGVLLARSMRYAIERARIEQVLQARTQALDERVKELNCLYGISGLVEQPGITLEEILQGMVDLIPPAWRYPDIACARLAWGERVFETVDFKETPWRQRADIRIHGQPGGVLEVCYLDQRPFLEEEQALLDAIAERCGRIIERIQARERIQQQTRRLRAQQEIDRAILAARSPQAIAQAALFHLRQLLPCRRASITLFDRDVQERVVLAVDVDGETELRAGLRLPPRENSVFQMLRRGQVHVVADIRALPQPRAIDQKLLSEGVGTYANLPLVVQGELIGNLNLGAAEPHTWSQERIDVAWEVADSVAIALQQARLYERVRRHAAELEERVVQRTAQLDERMAQVELLNRALANLLDDLQAANRFSQASARRLEEANIELEAFTYTVSHDLRAPLRAIQSFADALLEDSAESLGDAGREYAGRIRSVAQRMDGLIQDLLAYSRLSYDEIQIKGVGLDCVLERVLEELDVEIQEKAAQVIVVEPLPRVLGQRSILEQVVGNLVANALKFSTPDLPPQIRVWADERGDRVRVWVQDNGIGVPPAQHQRIFGIFERLHGIETYPGTGIGLAIVHRGVERLGGRVGVESEGVPSLGSRFWFELPRVEGGD